MTETIWLASYPKSGNTWFRMLVANLSATDGPVDINDLPERAGIASGRGGFEFSTLLDSGLLSHDEADRLRPRVYEDQAQDAESGEGPASPRFVKVHDAYVTSSAGEPLLAGARGARAAIVIVRDPRAVAPSLANHRQTSIDAAIGFLGNPAAGLATAVKSQPNQLRQRLLDWSGHVGSWLGQADLAVHLVRYESLEAAPVETLQAAMAFAGRAVTREAAARAVDFASFARLQAQERDKGFGEWQGRQAAARFFRRGKSQAWREELTSEQVRRIEAAQGRMMARLGYRTTICEEPEAAPIRAGDRR